MENPVHLDFEIYGLGWANLTIRVRHIEYEIEGLSYTTDALGDLLRAALLIATGAWTARASFDGEPVESRLIAGSVFENFAWRDGFWIRVLTFENIGHEAKDATGLVEFDARCEAEEFIGAVYDCAYRVFEADQNNTKEYAWAKSFPLRALRALEVAMASADPPAKEIG